MTTTSAPAPSAPAPSAAPSAQPAAVARAQPSKGTVPADSAKAARSPMARDKQIVADLEKRRSLRLVQADGTTVEQKPAEAKAGAAVEAKPETTEQAQGAAKVEDKPGETDEAKHWTQKAKAELDSAKAEVESFKKREAEWKTAALEVQAQTEDLTSERDHFKTLFDGARASLLQLGYDIDPLALKDAENTRELARMKRLMERGEASTKEQRQAQQADQLRAEIKPRIEGIFSKYPMLNTPDGREFLKAHVVAGALDKPDGLEKAAQAFALAKRTEAAVAKQVAQPTAAPAQVQTSTESKPNVPMTLGGMSGGGGSVRKPGQRLTPQALDKKIAADMAKRRAQRQ